MIDSNAINNKKENGSGNDGQRPAIIRCAIYTRKSTDENLDTDFNSLDAQREACELYIQSQAQEGWLVLPDRYDDAAYSGASMKRPALKRLIGDIGDDQIDCVVVYKIDRLSRSLADFTRLMEYFKRHEISMVSITQSFNTNTSSGVLFMNLLMTFASYEREVITERIRDKVAASKRRGMWMGGVPPLGYDVDFDKKELVVNPDEVKLVGKIFQRFLKLKSGVKLIRELNDNGHRTKSWLTKKGRYREGKAFNTGHIYRILNNALYLGLVKHKDKTYPGKHDAIINQTLWDAVQEQIKSHGLRGENGRAKTPALLKGIIRCGHCGSAMGISYSKKRNKSYRYYVCVNAAKNGYAVCLLKSVAASDLEVAVVNGLRKLFRGNVEADSIKLIKSLDAETVKVLQKVDDLWDNIFPVEQKRILNLLIQRVIVRYDGIEILLLKDGLIRLANEVLNDDQPAQTKDHKDRYISHSSPTVLPDSSDSSHVFTIHLPLTLKKMSGRKIIISPPDTQPQTKYSPAIQKPLLIALAKAHCWKKLLLCGKIHSIAELAEIINIDHSYINRLLNLTLLDPDIVNAILAGLEPSGLSLEKLTRKTPLVWEEQRRSFGFSLNNSDGDNIKIADIKK